MMTLYLNQVLQLFSASHRHIATHPHVKMECTLGSANDGNNVKVTLTCGELPLALGERKLRLWVLNLAQYIP